MSERNVLSIRFFCLCLWSSLSLDSVLCNDWYKSETKEGDHATNHKANQNSKHVTGAERGKACIRCQKRENM